LPEGTLLYRNTRYRRLSFLITLIAVLTIGFGAFGILGVFRGDNEQRTLGLILSAVFLASSVALHAFAKRYVVELVLCGQRVHVITGSLFTRRVCGVLVAMGPVIVEEVADGSNAHHRITVDPGARTFILDVTEDQDIARRLRELSVRCRD
jgi:hypothetical protein